MWLIITCLAALISTALWWTRRFNDRYRLGFLSLVYWGAALMWLVDHLIAYGQGERPFLEITSSATTLGFIVLGAGLFLWLVRLAIGKR